MANTVTYRSAADKPIGALAFSAPSLVLSAVLSSGLSKLLGHKRGSWQNYITSLSLPALYLAYVATKKNNGMLELHNGNKFIDRLTYPINDATYAGLTSLLTGMADSKLGYNDPDRSFLGTGLLHVDNSESARFLDRIQASRKYVGDYVDERKRPFPTIDRILRFDN